MGVTLVNSTLDGGVTPICEDCGIMLCYDISLDEYLEAKEFWDKWRCSECNPQWKGALQRWKAEHLKH